MFIVTAIDDYHEAVRFKFSEYEVAFWLLERLRDFGFTTSLHESTGWLERGPWEIVRGDAVLELLDKDLTSYYQ